MEEEDELQTYQRELVKEPMVTMDDVYAKETGRQQAFSRIQTLIHRLV